MGTAAAAADSGVVKVSVGSASHVLTERRAGSLTFVWNRSPEPSTHAADRQPTLAQLRLLPAATCAAIWVCARVCTRMPSSVPFYHALFV